MANKGSTTRVIQGVYEEGSTSGGTSSSSGGGRIPRSPRTPAVPRRRPRQGGGSAGGGGSAPPTSNKYGDLWSRYQQEKRNYPGGGQDFLNAYNKNHGTKWTMADLTKSGQLSGGSTGDTGGSSGKPAKTTKTSGSLEARVAREFPALLPYLKVPELRSIFDEWFKDRASSGSELYAKIISSDYYRKRNEDQRLFPTLGPADQEALIRQNQAKLYQWFLSNGSTSFLAKAGITDMDSDFIRWRAYRIAKGDISYEEMTSHWTGVLIKDYPDSPLSHSIEAERIAAAQFAQRDEDYLEDIFDSATNEYYLPRDKKSYAALAKQLANGEITASDVQDYLRTQATELFPRYAEHIKRGIAPANFIEPKLRIVANELDVSSDDLRADPKVWERMVADAAATNSQMSGMDWVRFARSMPQYVGSKGARDDTSSLMGAFSRAFGKAVG